MSFSLFIGGCSTDFCLPFLSRMSFYPHPSFFSFFVKLAASFISSISDTPAPSGPFLRRTRRCSFDKIPHEVISVSPQLIFRASQLVPWVAFQPQTGFPQQAPHLPPSPLSILVFSLSDHDVPSRVAGVL